MGAGPAAGDQTSAPPDAVPAAQVEAAVAARPGDYELQMNAAQLYMTRGQNAAAIPHLEAAARLQPALPLPWIALGDARMLAGQAAGARTAYARARRLAPGEPLIDRGLGQLLIREGRLKEARSLLEAAVRRHPGSVDLRLALGNLALVLNQPARAIEVLEPAARAAPDSADVHYLLGQAYERNLHIQAALREQQAAVAADPTFAEAYGRIGLYLIDLTRYAEARPPLQEAMRLNPREAHYYWALGDSYLLDTSAAENLGRAIPLYRQALGVDPHNEQALMSLGLGLARRGGQGDLEEAAGVLRRLVSQHPAHANAWYRLYETETRLGHLEAAGQAMARFQRLQQRGRQSTVRRYQTVAFVDTAAAHLRLGRRYLAEGQAGAAAAEFRLALERDPRLAAARDGLTRAGSLRQGAGPAR
jgi:predicted Zn-dependent protease